MKLGHFGFRTFGQKLRILIVSVPVVVLIGTAIVGYFSNEWWMHNQELREIRMELKANAKALDEFFRRVAILPRCVAARQRALEKPSQPNPNTPSILLEMLESAAWKECYGLYIAFDGIDPTKRADGMQSVDRVKKTQTRMLYDHNDKSNPLTSWYHGAVSNWRKNLESGGDAKHEAHYVEEPTFDAGGSDVLLVRISQVVHDIQGRLIGVAGVDLVCESLNEFADTIVATQSERKAAGGRLMGVDAFLLSPTNKVIARTDRKPLPKVPAPFEEGGQRMTPGLDFPDVGLPITVDKTRRLLFCITAQQSGWKIVLSVPETEIDDSARAMVVRSTFLGSIGPAVLVLVASVLAGWLTGPIPRLTAAAEAVEAGDYRCRGLDSIAARKDEFGHLARGFRRMVGEVSTRESQLKQAQAEILRRESHFRSLIENGSDVISVLDRRGTIRYESPSVRRVLGYEADELSGSSCFDAIHPDDLSSVTAAFDRHFRGLSIESSIEYRIRHKDGSWRTLEATSANLLDDPAVEGIVVNSRDVTERKRAQTELDGLRRRVSDELEEGVRIRTAELGHKNEELKAANEAIDQAMKLQEVFLSNVAHDLRTPLTIVIGYSEDLLRRARKQGQAAFIPDLNLIVNKGKDLLELINDLLNLSKAMNEKGVELDLKQFEVAPMIRSRMEGIGAIAQKQGNTIDLRIAPDVGAMFADESKVWRVLMNLLTNACKFTKDGLITLDAERVSCGSGDRLIFQVVDTGMGMNPEQTARQFDRFSQFHASSGKMQAGVGLGLSICQLYCRAMGGTIGVESEVGRGTTFRVDLPAKVAQKPTIKPSPVRTIQATVEPPIVDPSVPSDPTLEERANLVLIIDDDASVCKLIRRNLDEEGLPSLGAISEDGLRPAGRRLPSAIIVDIMMPGINGWAVLAALKTDTESNEIPVIMASMLDEEEWDLRIGTDESAARPFRPDRLTELLRKHLRGRDSGKILCIEGRSDASDQLAKSLSKQGWEVREATRWASAREVLRDFSPDLILIDLMVPDDDGMSILAQIRSNVDWQAIPIIVITAADLDHDARRRLQRQVETIFKPGIFGRDDLLRVVRSLVSEHHREHPTKLPSN